MENSTPATQVRSLKVQPQLRVNRWSSTPIAEIRLSGLWLMELGFIPQQRVTVTATRKRLIIELDDQ